FAGKSFLVRILHAFSDGRLHIFRNASFCVDVPYRPPRQKLSRICHPALSCSFRCTVRRALKTRTGAVGDNSAWAVPLSRPPNCNLPLCGGGTIDEALACQERKCFVSSGEGVSYACIFFSR